MVNKVEGPPQIGGSGSSEKYAEVPVDMVDKVFRLPRIYDPQHPEADKDGRRPARPAEHAQARRQEAGGYEEADVEHNIFDWR